MTKLLALSMGALFILVLLVSLSGMWVAEAVRDKTFAKVPALPLTSTTITFLSASNGRVQMEINGLPFEVLVGSNLKVAK